MTKTCISHEWLSTPWTGTCRVEQNCPSLSGVQRTYKCLNGYDPLTQANSSITWTKWTILVYPCCYIKTPYTVQLIRNIISFLTHLDGGKKYQYLCLAELFSFFFCFKRQGFSVALESVLELVLIYHSGHELTVICQPLPPKRVWRCVSPPPSEGCFLYRRMATFFFPVSLHGAREQGKMLFCPFIRELILVTSWCNHFLKALLPNSIAQKVNFQCSSWNGNHLCTVTVTQCAVS